MTFEQLRVLQAIVTAGTFRGAADKLNKSQPAISTMIKNLEAEIGLEIFSRAGYRPTLTETGRIFYEKSLLVLEQTLQLSTFAKRLSNHEELRVTIAINAVCQLKDILVKLKEIETQYPATQICLNIEQLGGTIERLFEDEADLIISTNTGVNPDIMEAVPYSNVRIIPVAAHDYPLAQSQTMLSTEEVRPYVQIIVVDSSHAGDKQTLDVISDNRRWMVTDFSTKKEIIMAGMGWGGLPEHLIAEELKAGTLKSLYISQFEIRHSQLYLVRRTDRPTGVVAEAIWQTLSEKATV